MEMARQEGAAEEGVGIELEEYDAGVHRRSAASIQDEDEEPEATTPKPSLYSGGRHNLRRRHHRGGDVDVEGGGVAALRLWWAARSARKQERRRYGCGVAALLAVGAVLLALIILHGTYDLLETTGKQQALLSDQLLKRLNNGTRIMEHYPHTAKAANTTTGRFVPEQDISISKHKVVYVIVDGLRYDYLWKNPKLRALVTRPDFAEDSRAWKIYASTPTISVPNWASLVTGVPPEINGFLANDGRKEMVFDSMFRSARRFGVHRAVAGVSWLSHMYRSDLELVRGDGAITQTALREYELVSPDPMAAEMLLNSFDPKSPDYMPYRLFLMHFMAVDDMGHLHGVTTDYNPYNTYQKAISNTTQVLTRLVDLLDNETTLVITSDHGHIDRGGHGGTHPQLKAIPLIVYQRGSGLGKGVKVDYPPAESDKSDLPEPKLPIGGSDGGGDDSANYEGAKRSAGDVDTDDDIVANQAATSTLTYGLSAERAQSNLAVVGTVCGLLGIPLPRQSLGLVVEEVIDHLLVADPHHREAVYRDLFLQKKALVYELLQVLDVDMGPLTATLNYSVSDTTTDDCMTSATTATPEARVECYKAKANHLLRAWYANRDDELEARVTRNVLINLGVTLVALGLVLGLVQRYSLANPRAIPAYVWRAGAVPLARRLIRAGRALARRGLRRPLTINGMGDGLSALEEVDDDGSVVVVAELNDAAERDTAGSEAAQDMQALLGSFVVVGTYYLINIVAVVLYCKQQGNDWDFTLWNFDVDAYLYLALIPVMSVFVFLILAHLHSFVVVYRTIRRLRAADCVHETALVAGAGLLSMAPQVLVYQLYPSSSLTPGGDHHQWPGGWKTSFRSTLRCSCSAAYQAAMVVERYLFAHYTLLVAVMGMVVIKALEGCYGVFLLPGMWRVVLLNDQTWDLRFRLIGVELMQAPLFGLALLQLGLLLYLPRFSASSALFDLLFTRRRRTCGAGAPSSSSSLSSSSSARHAHRSLPTQEEFAEDNNGSELVVDRFVADQAADDDDDNDNENENGTRGEEDDEEDEIESVPVDDLPALLARAASQVGRVASPIVFFEAQALQEMV